MLIGQDPFNYRRIWHALSGWVIRATRQRSQAGRPARHRHPLLQFRWERGTPIRNGMHTYTHSGLNLVRIHTDAGTGIGWAHMARVAGALEHFKPLLIGQDPFNYRRIWALWVPKLVGRRGIATRFISGIDIALWDLDGQSHR